MSEGTDNMTKLAGVIDCLRAERHTIPQLVEKTGAHRRTVAKWIAVLQQRGHVRPRGSKVEPKHAVLLWEWVK